MYYSLLYLFLHILVKYT